MPVITAPKSQAKYDIIVIGSGAGGGQAAYVAAMEPTNRHGDLPTRCASNVGPCGYRLGIYSTLCPGCIDSDRSRSACNAFHIIHRSPLR
jgi:hypothetical protein